MLDQTALWERITREARATAAEEPGLSGFLEIAIFRNEDLALALAALLARKLGDGFMSSDRLGTIVRAAISSDPAILSAAVADLAAIMARDPAARGISSPFLFFKGFHALQSHRIGNFLWREGRRDLARFFQSRISEVFAVDIHPAVPVGSGVFIDHGTGVVIGETATIGNDVSILQNVTLGGTGRERGDRHPKVHDGVLLSAGAKVLGNIVIGRNARVGAGSVVLRDVPPNATVVGVPARVVGWGHDIPAHEMDQGFLDYSI